MILYGSIIYIVELNSFSRTVYYPMSIIVQSCGEYIETINYFKSMSNHLNAIGAVT